MPIAGLSGQRRLPRDGKIKLGVKVTKPGRNGNKIEYPVQTKYFVVPDPIKEIYGAEPTEIDIMFPSEEMELIFPQYYKCYGSVGLKCKGDGEKAMTMAKGQLIEKLCTPLDLECIKQGCKPVATLKVLLPKVPGFGVWDFNTSSYNSIVNLNTCIDTIRLMTGGRVSFIPLKLKYEPHMGTVYDEKKDMQFQKEVYVMSITISDTIEDFYNKFRLPDPRENKQLAHMMDVNAKFAALLESKNESFIDAEGEDFEDCIEGEHEPAAIMCEDCGNEITGRHTPQGFYSADDIANKSMEAFKKHLCADCSKKAAAKNKPEAK